jgi:SAM-dependent methyltransferase
MESEYSKRECFEKSFIKTSKPFLVESYCYVCKQKVQMSVDYAYSYKKNGVLTLNWREHMVCPLCGLSNRMRASIHLFEQILQPSKQSRIYILEQTTPLYDWFIKNYSYVVGSEYLGKTIPPGGMNAKGIRNESITELSFPDNKFDFILSFDVFEHVPNFQKAFSECYRVLKQNGRLFFTVPFEVNSKENIIRAVKNDNNKIEYLLPPEYHGDPLSPEGCLAFYCFGWEMLEQLKVAGFTHANAHLYWSQEFGYLGGEQIVFVAEKD